MKNKPNIIYLQTGIPLGQIEHVDWNSADLMKDEITWSTNQVHKSDFIYYSEEFMFEFAKWINSKYIRLTKGWITTEDNTSRKLFTTKELLEEFKNIKNEPK